MTIYYVEKWTGLQLYADIAHTQFIGTISPCYIAGYKWILCREWNGRADDVPPLSRHRTIDAAKYRALSDWLDHCEAIKSENEMAEIVRDMHPEV